MGCNNKGTHRRCFAINQCTRSFCSTEQKKRKINFHKNKIKNKRIKKSFSQEIKYLRERAKRGYRCSSMGWNGDKCPHKKTTAKPRLPRFQNR